MIASRDDGNSGREAAKAQTALCASIERCFIHLSSPVCIHRPETDAIGVQTLVHGIEAIAVSSLPPATLREVFGATAELPEGVATEAA